MKPVRCIAAFHLGLSPTTKAIIASTTAALSFVAGVLLEPKVQLAWGDSPDDNLSGLLWIIGVVSLVVVYGIARHVISGEQTRISERRQRQDAAIANAREKAAGVDRGTLVRLGQVHEAETLTIEEYVDALALDSGRLDALVTAIWEVVNSTHNLASSSLDRLSFEVTLITRSTKDSDLTIAAWANRDNRAPRSLRLREKKSDIYQGTMAARMIQDGMVDLLVVPDTSSPEVGYASLYEGQKDRIKSTVLLPVLSSTSEHLGIIVVHCDKTGVFGSEDKRYWKELLSVFAPGAAICLERIRAHNNAVRRFGTVSLRPAQPF